ncbi:MAG: LysR family transcriptional regulator [Clostridia bacterium]|nr:LysR family transcriptional regulator [Clostridia bacterium]
MELLQLRYFLETSKNQSFTKTAEKYGVPTTSVSASIKRLESELGVKLFDRTANKITINKNGERLKNAVTSAFFEIDSAVYDISKSNAVREIKMLVKAVRSNVTDYIIKYSQKYPNIVFKTVFDFLESDYQKYDIVIDEKGDKYVGYGGFELLSMNIKMKVSQSIYTSKKLKLKDLEGEKFISWGENSNMHKSLVRACESAGFYPNVVINANDNDCYERFVKAGVGIGLGRENHDRDYPHIKYLDVVDFNEKYVVYCYYNPATCTGETKNFIEFLRNQKSDL